MTRHVVAAAAEIAPGEMKRVTAGGRPVCVFNLDGSFHALVDRCPHEGAALSAGRLCGIVTASAPGEYRLCRQGEMVRCPWHGWEFDIRTGQSWSDPRATRVRSLPAAVEAGAELVKGPYVAERLEITREGAYLVIEI
ncbi:Rieske 2Fe-2S domain-containing protein [Oceanicella sp. SM1341]|uniref:Rieske (2Fe-2S) protein n=1 Tax=Oceanicella sp. SM1341 TaxID=1548889 RepID=UPI000E4D8041|nr:Rieske 2Fe-2S domain-containing protein [Oceanicella sp. SM1341]